MSISSFLHKNDRSLLLWETAADEAIIFKFKYDYANLKVIIDKKIGITINDYKKNLINLINHFQKNKSLIQN